MVLIYILRYLSFIDFYAEVRNAESTQSLYQINVYNKAGQQSQFLSCIKSILHLCLTLRNNFVKEISQSLPVDTPICIYIAFQNKVFDE